MTTLPFASLRSSRSSRSPFALTSLALATLAVLGLLAGACGGDPNEGREIVRPDISELPPDQVEQPRERGELRYDLPERWQEETPTSNMRLAQASIPGDAGAAELAIFYFGPGQGGGVEANIDRWIAQVELAPGSEPVRETIEQGDLAIHTVEARGTVTGSPMTMAGGQPTPEAGSMLLGAVVEGPGGPWFFKITGPVETVEAAKDEFVGMLQDLEVEAQGTAA